MHLTPDDPTPTVVGDWRRPERPADRAIVSKRCDGSYSACVIIDRPAGGRQPRCPIET